MMNNSLANFDLPELKLIYHNPYNNSLGENNQIIIALVVLFCLIILFFILLKIGLLKYAKYSFDNNKLNVIDMIYCYQITVSLIEDFLVLVFKRYVNIYGPIYNQKWAFALTCIDKFCNINFLLSSFEILLLWYFIEKVLKNKIEMDNFGTAQCLVFFNLSWSIGLAFLVSGVGIEFHKEVERMTGLPLDFSENYLINTR